MKGDVILMGKVKWPSKNKTNENRLTSTASGKLFGVARDLSSELVNDIERWVKINKSLVKKYVLTIIGIISFVLFICLGVLLSDYLTGGGQVALTIIYIGIIVTTLFYVVYYFESHADKPKKRWALYYDGRRQTQFHYADSNEEAVKHGNAMLEAMEKEMGEDWNRIYPHPLWQVRSMDN
jgi:hypothetical protein